MLIRQNVFAIGKIAVFWTLFGLFSIFSSYVYYEGTTTAFNWQIQLPVRMPSYLLWVLFTPFLFVLVDKNADTKKIADMVRVILGGIGLALSQRILVYLVTLKIKLWIGLSHTGIQESLSNEFYFILSAVFDSTMIAFAVVVYRFSTNNYREAMINRMRSQRLESDLQRAKLNALQMQLQPHFLFNAMHAISSFVYSDPEKADRMICLLSELLRKTLDLKDTLYIPLRDEVELMRKYLEIQELRFADKFSAEFVISEASEQKLVPVFIVQPLLENIMKHAVEKQNSRKHICIESDFRDTTLTLKVTENGDGFQSLDEAVHEGMGLQNLQRRLNTLQRPGKILINHTKKDGLFTIEVQIPEIANV